MVVGKNVYTLERSSESARARNSAARALRRPASVVFGLIHMKDFSSLNEWLNFPDYLFAGLILSFVYHRFGFEGSVAAHVLNNLIAVISALIV